MIGTQVPGLSPGENRQLRTLYALYKNPFITGIWERDDCEALRERGYAQRTEYSGIGVYSITPEGIRVWEAADNPDGDDCKICGSPAEHRRRHG